jgi:hypothetical protein
MLASAALIAAACALTPAAAATTSPSPPTAVRSDPPPEEEPCPSGEPKPCGASSQERGGVESGREDAKKAAAEAKKDIAEAKDKAEQCAPGSAQGKQCMTNLIGTGADEHAGMDDVRHELDTFRPAPSDNAGAVMHSACAMFAAGLPPVLKASDTSGALTGVCELMNQ